MKDSFCCRSTGSDEIGEKPICENSHYREGKERLAIMRRVAQNSFEDDNPGNEDLDRIFSRLDQLNPPTDFVHRLMQVVSRLPLPQLLQPGDRQAWDDEGPIVHHEHKHSS
jgi:hypothetical protein